MTRFLSSTALAVALLLTAQAQAQNSAPTTPAEQHAQGYLGVVIEKKSQDAPLVIQRVLDGSSAQAAGLLEDDQILAVDDVDTDSLTLEEAANRLRGPVGSWVTLAILSGEDRFDLSIQRRPWVPDTGNEI